MAECSVRTFLRLYSTECPIASKNWGNWSMCQVEHGWIMSLLKLLVEILPTEVFAFALDKCIKYIGIAWQKPNFSLKNNSKEEQILTTEVS